MNWHPARVLHITLLLGAIVWMTVALASSLGKSAAIDEVPHIGAGLSALTYGDFRMNPEHPPLMKILSVLPVYIFARPDMTLEIGGVKVNPWVQGFQVEYGYHLLFDAGQDPRRILLLARIVPVLAGLLGGVFAFLWGREISGRPWGGALAAFFLLFYPEYIGHSRFVTLDVPTLTACAAVSWFAWKWWRRPCWANVFTFAIVSAIGSEIKLPVSLFIVLTLCTLAACAFARFFAIRRDSNWTAYRGIIGQLMALFAITAILCIFAAWAGSAFRFSYFPKGISPPEFPSNYLPRSDHVPNGAIEWFADFAWRHHLLPETTIATISHSGSFAIRVKYLMGRLSKAGWYDYFLITFLLKTPLLMTGGMAAAIVAGVWGMTRHTNKRARALKTARAVILGMPFLLLFLIFVRARVNIGHRQVLFIYFPLCVMLGSALARWLARPGPPRLLASGIIAAQIANIIVVYPHYETYFNEVIRKPYIGSEYVVDSNVDWGQDVPLLAKALDRLGVTNINYAVFGYNRPQSFGIEHFRWLLPQYPYAVYMPEPVEPDFTIPSAISLNNLPHLRNRYPGQLARDPDLILNSIVLFLPRQQDFPLQY